jgi:hypothetical protein
VRSRPSVKLASLPHIGRSLWTLRFPEGILSVHRDLATCYCLDIMDRDLSRQEPEFLSAELLNPRSPKRVVSQHVTSLNWTVHNCSGVSTQENPDPLSPGLPILRFSIPWNGRSHDTWPPSIGWLRSVPGFSPWKIPNSCQQESRFRDS